MPHEIRVRFAPSPTGYLHVGGARTALFNWLFAKSTGGTFILRIEDTDRSRYQEAALAEIFTSLRWLGLDWDEGPEAGGARGPYFQSERLPLYLEHVDLLVRAGHAYPCFCTSERLDALRREQEAAKLPHVGYDRLCRRLPPGEASTRRAAGDPCVIRFAVPEEPRPVAFHDLIRGGIEYRTDVLDDFVLLKSDGYPTYHLANVVDDRHMGISHVLRGDEWIASTPRHILLYEAFDWPPPVFAHLPVILSPGGGKLSKRKGAASVMDYKASGFLPEALLNFLALLGWAPGDDREVMAREEIAAAFTLDRVGAKPAVFDEEKLAWMNGQYMMERSAEALLTEIRPLWAKLGLTDGSEPWLARVVDLMKSRARRLTELAENSVYFFRDPENYEDKAAAKYFGPEGPALLRELAGALAGAERFDTASLDALYRAAAEARSVSPGKLIHPTRLAVSGVSFGPGLFEMMEVLGRETVLRRMETAARRIEEKR
jgi:glutamyl-tRNA synthetase